MNNLRIMKNFNEITLYTIKNYFSIPLIVIDLVSINIEERLEEIFLPIIE